MLELHHLGGPTQVDIRPRLIQSLDLLNQIHLYIKLLNIDEWGLLAHGKLLLVSQVERKHFILARKCASDLPSHAFGCDAFKDAQPGKDFQ